MLWEGRPKAAFERYKVLFLFTPAYVFFMWKRGLSPISHFHLSL